MLPEMTPLIDVVFLLLIFFMVSTVFKKNELALLLQLPEGKAGEAKTTKIIKQMVIELTEKEVAFNGKKMALTDLNSEFKAVENKKIPIELRIDHDVRYNRVIDLLDRLKKFNLNNLELVTKE